jgi:kynurenine formamidase
MRAGAELLEALAMVREGRTFDLSSGWWPGMPVHEAHPRFEVLTYRSPRGERNQRDLDFLDEAHETSGFGFVSELLQCTSHSGTHVDALCHTVGGPRSEWHGGHSADDALGDFGALSEDASEIEPLIAPGVLLDIPALHGVDTLPANHRIGASELEAAAERAGAEIAPGCVVLVRTGQMRNWPSERELAAAAGSGVGVEGATWLADRKPAAVGADTATFECNSSEVEGVPQPVHLLLLRDRGIHIIEWVDCEELAAEGVGSFLFVAIPLPIRGATGSLLRPLAIT